MDVNPEDIGLRFRSLSAFLDERMRRLVTAAESPTIGSGGVSVVARATGLLRRAITEGMKELSQPKGSQAAPAAQFRIRRKGAGRKRAVDKDPGLREDLDRLVDPVTRADETGLEIAVCHFRRAPANGTRSNTVSSLSSVRTGAANR